MDINQHKRVKTIFLSAIDMNPQEIENYINAQSDDIEIISQALELVNTYQNNTQHTQDFIQEVAENISCSSLLFPTDRYTLIKKIGQGGSGDVFLAQRKFKNIKQKVAIKILHLDDNASKSRFSQETSILSQLSHKKISANLLMQIS